MAAKRTRTKPSTVRTDLKEKRIKLILQLIREGHFVRFACKAAGIHHDTWYEWQAKDPELVAKQEEAELHQVRIQLDKITHADDPRWAAWFIERKMPDWRKPELQQITVQGEPTIKLSWPEEPPKKDE